MEKAIKEAKVHTSWVNPNEAYDHAVSKFVKEVLVADPANSFLSDFLQFHRRVAYPGMLSSLSRRFLRSPRLESRTSIRGQNSGIIAWWIPITVDRWTSANE